MEIVQAWTAIFQYHITGGAAMPPTANLSDPDVFYVSDGVGTPFGAMRLRKISLETGDELASVLTRNWVRCICENEESIYAVLDKRILKINRKDFHLEESYTKNIPRYSDYVDFAAEDTLILMNSNGGSLHQFNFKTQKSSRKKISSDYFIYHVIKADTDTVYIFTEQEILQYSPQSNEIKKLLETEACRDSVMDSAGKTYLLCSSKRSRPRSSRILVYSSLTDANPETLFPGCVAAHFWLLEETNQLYMTYDNKLWIYSVDEKKMIFHHIFDNDIFHIFVKTNTVLTLDASNNCMTCFKIRQHL